MSMSYWQIDHVSAGLPPVCLQVEYMLVEFDDKEEKVRLALNTGHLLEILQDQGERINPK